MYKIYIKMCVIKNKKKGKIIKKISWTETLRNMEVGEFIHANLSERINIVRHITRIHQMEDKVFRTKKLNISTVEIIRVE